MAFDTLEIALQLITDLSRPLALIEARDGDLARQLRRAATSVPLNVSEGRERAGKDRAHHFRIALGSVSETRTALRIALAWGHVREPDVAAALASIDRVRAMLWRQTRR